MSKNLNTNETEINGAAKLHDKEYLRLSSYIMSQYGIKLPPIKKSLLQGRLQKRLKALDLKNFKEYTDYLFSAAGQKEEIAHMIDAVSTNKTDFFREPIHFKFLLEAGIKEYTAGNSKRLSVWSAGCSSGEEPYSIAMTLKEYSLHNPGVDFQIIATDISNGVLEHAGIGIYNIEKIEMIPLDLRKKYLLKGKNAYKNKVRIHPEIRKKITFQKFNLVSSKYSSIGKQDFIFCRNVLIYFERELQNRILSQLCQQLFTGGYLFLGHSESITGFDLPLKQIKPTIFRKI
ncbi:MAG: CheR family methyltransferase [Bacteroidales bacterium]|jgi:chemotaxis protein methyltransferase CheR